MAHAQNRLETHPAAQNERRPAEIAGGSATILRTYLALPRLSLGSVVIDGLCAQDAGVECQGQGAHATPAPNDRRRIPSTIAIGRSCVISVTLEGQMLKAEDTRTDFFKVTKSRSTWTR
jgi:hypothetical protein